MLCCDGMANPCIYCDCSTSVEHEEARLGYTPFQSFGAGPKVQGIKAVVAWHGAIEVLWWSHAGAPAWAGRSAGHHNLHMIELIYLDRITGARVVWLVQLPGSLFRAVCH